MASKRTFNNGHWASFDGTKVPYVIFTARGDVYEASPGTEVLEIRQGVWTRHPGHPWVLTRRAAA